MMEQFRALVVNNKDENFSKEIKQLKFNELQEGEVLIKVAYSSVNYKDGLATIPNGSIVTQYPFIPGIDLSGKVVSSSDQRFKEGDDVVATGYGIGENHYGGFSEYAQINADWIVPLPKGLTLKEAMAYGTAGFTAALSVEQLQKNGVTPDKGEVLVTGSTGGVGSLSIAMLAKQGYSVVASTGKLNESDYLKKIGASKVISREEIKPIKKRALGKEHWAGVVDPVGGETLSSVVSNLQYDGAAAVSGFLGGKVISASIFPFILRGVKILGIDSVYCPMEVRQSLWERMASDLKPDTLLSDIGREVSLEGLPDILTNILEGKVLGRTIVNISNV